MMNATSNLLLSALLLATFGLFVGCGDYPVDSSAEVEPGRSSVQLLGRTVYLRRRSALCGSLFSNPLVAQIGGAVEFPGAQTRALESSCAGALSPALEVSVDGQSLIFDFSSVDQAGIFPEAPFEGYELTFARHCGDVALAGVSMDTERSTMRSADVGVSHHYDRIRVDFSGTAYDRASFIKIDLEFVDVTCLEEKQGIRH